MSFGKIDDWLCGVSRQLMAAETLRISMYRTCLRLDCRVIFNQETAQEGLPVFWLIPGMGSGWEGITELGFWLTKRGNKVVFLSFPGSGNSTNAPKWYYERDDYIYEADAMLLAKEELERRGLFQGKIIPVGHSLGGEFAAQFAASYPEHVERLVLLTPSGVERIGSRIGMIKLAGSFATSGALLNAEHFLTGRKTPYDFLKHSFPEPESCFTKERLLQRLSEFRRICRGSLLSVLERIECPIVGIWGSRDFVFPYSQSLKIESVAGKNFRSYEISGAWHNVTLRRKSQDTADIILGL